MSRHNHNRRWSPRCCTCGRARHRLVEGSCEACRSADGSKLLQARRAAKAARRRAARGFIPPLVVAS